MKKFRGGIHMQKFSDRLMSLMTSEPEKSNTPGWARLAMAGFYRSSKNFARDQPKDLIKCFYCMMEKGYWCESDDPVKIHKQLSPNCKWMKYDIRTSEEGCSATIPERVLIKDKQSIMFNRLLDDKSWARDFPYPRIFIDHIRNSVSWLYNSLNLNIRQEAQLPPLILSEQPVFSDDTTRLLDWILYNSEIINDELELLIRRKIWWYVNNTYVEANGYVSAVDDSVSVHNGDDDLCIASNRMATFKTNSTPFLQKNAEALAMAGFYRAPENDGNIDDCYCFFCGVCGGCWEEDEDPYHEHVKWANDCAYIRTKFNKPQMISILYHSYKDKLAKSFDRDFKRSVLEVILDIQSCSQDDMIVKASIFRCLERRADLLELIEHFTITEIVKELFHKVSVDGLNMDGAIAMVLNITRKDLEVLLTIRYGRKPCALCECQNSTGVDDAKPGMSCAEVTDFNPDEVEPPSIEELLSLPMPKPEPPKTLPYAQLPARARATMFANEEYRKYTREQAIEKLENLLQSYNCVVCMAAPSCIAFMPCRHMVTCDNCNMGNSLATCPICRTKIDAQIPIRLCETQLLGCYA